MKNTIQIQTRKRKKLPGITFIEILVVLLIISLIAGIVGAQLLGEAEKAKVDSTKIQIKSLETALGLYRLHNSTYPTTEQGLMALIEKPSLGNVPKRWQGPYLDANNVPTDSWQNPYLYLSDGRKFVIISLGGDGLEGGEEIDADISSEDL